MSLERFREAQDAAHAGFDTALAELRAGQKTSHWIWYVFPQLAGLGRSPTAQFYGLNGLEDACDYLRDSVLRQRLFFATETVAERLAHGIRITDLMGGTTDSLKLVSSLTLFQLAAKKLNQPGADPVFAELEVLCENVLAVAESQGFARCHYTLTHVSDE